MAWTPLAGRLSDLPLVLAGPILRQVTKSSVTVCVTLKTNNEIFLTVYDTDKDTPTGKILRTGARLTAAVGKNLFIVAARSTESPFENNIYFCDLKFMAVDGQLNSMNLLEAITKRGGTQDPTTRAYST
jgi:hypothetical protein